MKKRETKRRKIITYYVVAIVFPSIILGILAFRGVKNDQALVEREQQRAFQESGQKINDDVDAYLFMIENSFNEIVESASFPDRIMFSDSALTSLINLYPAIEGIFYLSAENEISVLNNHFLYEPDQYSERKQRIVSEQLENILEKGWELELKQKKYIQAIEHYDNALKFIDNKNEQGIIFNSIARIQKKLSQQEEAIKTYKTLSDSCPDVYIQGNLPLGMIASLESALLYLEIQDTTHCMELLNSLLIQIVNWNCKNIK